MPYRDEINVMPHDFAQSATTVGDGDAKHNVVGIQSFSVMRTTPRVSTGSANDGFSWYNKSPDRRAELKIVVKENSPSNDQLWDLWEADEQFTLAHSDPACPNLKVNATVRIENAPEVVRDGEIKDIEYTFLATYCSYRGGGYKLVVAS